MSTPAPPVATRHISTATLQAYPDDGHVSVLRHAGEALTWLVAHAAR